MFLLVKIARQVESMSSESMLCCTDTYIRLIKEMVLDVSMFGDVVQEPFLVDVGRAADEDRALGLFSSFLL